MMTSLHVIIKIYKKQPYPKMKYKEKERDYLAVVKIEELNYELDS